MFLEFIGHLFECSCLHLKIRLIEIVDKLG